MVSSLINWLFRRHTVSYKLHKIEKLISEKSFCKAIVTSYIALQKFPNQPELLALKAQAEKGFSSYLYPQE